MAIGGRGRSIWRNRGFVLVWGGQSVSLFGDNVTAIALPWLVVAATRSPLDAALVMAARYLPMVLLGLPVGLLADRLPRRALLIGCDLLRAGALALVVGLTLAGRTPTLGALALIVVALGIGQTGFQAAYWAWLPAVAGEEDYGRVVAASEAADAAGALAGPAVGGLVIQAIGPALALGADLLSYLVSALVFWRVRPPEPPRPALEERLGDLARATIAGGRFILASAEQRLLRGLYTILYVYTSAFGVLLVALTQQRLHLPAAAAGIVFAGAGAGGLLGSALAPRVMAKPWASGAALAMAVSGIGALTLALVAASPTPTAVATATFATAALDGAASLSFIVLGVRATLRTPEELRGRANAAGGIYAALTRGLGVIALGAAATRFGLTVTFLALAAGFALAAGAAARAARHPDPSPPGAAAAAPLTESVAR